MAPDADAASLVRRGDPFAPLTSEWLAVGDGPATRAVVRALLTQANAIDAAQNNSMLLGHRAWLSWRDGNSVQAETYARASLEGQQCQQQKESNPFLWVGLWPLMGIMLVQHRTNEAINGVHVLLDPTQHPQPPELRTLLEQALQAWNSGQHAEAHRLLLQVVPLAEQKGYL